ncbi:FecR domain-containing protein [Pseudomonas sp. PDNC002]|uniref:FecR family protein n=1 Tax=Pseudomonas sp. PDNC002 TaxID=2811422 RepID=UPI00196663BF|nr:FecR domain-containing protein [Pseudomonas sp. PDNC002]QRY77373.1 FecR domain-containing protein [Pseudomonas sp. PDNC002]
MRDEALLNEAAEWLVRLEDEPQRQAEFDAWCASDPRRAAAARSLTNMLQRFDLLSAAPAHAALDAAQDLDHQRRSRRSGGVALALAFATLLPLGMFLHANPPSYLLADLRTGTSQWQQTRLDDGSQVILDGRSAADLDFDAHRRTVRLIQGDILVEVAHDSARPFIVETAHGSIRALGTRFIVERRDDATWLTMLESRVEVRSVTGATVEVAAGQRLRLDDQGLGQPQRVDSSTFEHAWRNHQWVVWDRPLPEVLKELDRTFNGYLAYDAKALADLRVSAVLPMDDPQRALRLLARSFPLQVKSYGPWLLQVSRENSRE